VGRKENHEVRHLGTLKTHFERLIPRLQGNIPTPLKTSAAWLHLRDLNLKTLYVFDETVMLQDKRLDGETPVLVDPTDPPEYGPEVREPADIKKHIEAAEKNFIEALPQIKKQGMLRRERVPPMFEGMEWKVRHLGGGS
jgi:hypothetical protein